MTPYWNVYNAFLAKTLEDEWGDWTPEETQEDLRQLLESAIPYFKFPQSRLQTIRSLRRWLNSLLF